MSYTSHLRRTHHQNTTHIAYSHRSGPFISDSLFRHHTYTLLAPLYLYVTLTNEHFLSRPQTPPAHPFAIYLDTRPVAYFSRSTGQLNFISPGPFVTRTPCLVPPDQLTSVCSLHQLTLLLDIFRAPFPASRLASFGSTDHTLICIRSPTQTHVYASLRLSADVDFVPSTRPL